MKHKPASTTKYIIPLILTLASKPAYSFEDIELVKEKVLRPFYYGNQFDIGAIRKMEQIAMASYSTVDSEIAAHHKSWTTTVTEGFNETTASIKPSYMQVRACIDNLEPLAAVLKDYIAEEQSLRSQAEVDAYRRATLTADRMNLFTDLIIEVQKLHAGCYQALDAVRELNYNFKSYADGLKYNLCDIYKDFKYDNFTFTRNINIKPEYKIDNSFKWPNVQVNYSLDTTCATSSSTTYGDCSYQWVSGEGVPYASKYQAEREKARMAILVGSGAFMQFYPGFIPYLGGKIGISSAAVANVAVPAAVFLAVELTISYIEQEERRREIKALDRFIEDAEAKIAEAAKKTIKEEEFNEKRDRYCKDHQKDLDKLVNELILSVESDKHIASVNSFFRDVDGLISWYNDLFLFATNGSSGARIIDQVGEQKILDRRERIAQVINANKSQIYFAKAKSDMQASQSAIASSCLVGATKVEKVRNLKASARKFRNMCEDQSRLISLKTSALKSADGSLTDVICSYQGLKNADRMVLAINRDETLKIDVYNGSDLVTSADNVSSQESPYLYLTCTSDSDSSFGTPGGVKLVPQTLALTFTESVAGAIIDDFSKLKADVQRINRNAQTALSMCSRSLGFAVPIQSDVECLRNPR